MQSRLISGGKLAGFAATTQSLCRYDKVDYDNLNYFIIPFELSPYIKPFLFQVIFFNIPLNKFHLAKFILLLVERIKHQFF